MKVPSINHLIITVFWIGSLAACGPAPAPEVTASPSPFQPLPATPSGTASPLPTSTATTAPPTRTLIVAPSFTPAPTLAPLDTPTPKPPKVNYVFPVIAPAYAIDYAPGGHGGYLATDIFAPEGSLFVAPTSGVVELVTLVDSWDPATDRPEDRSGLAVAIIGDDGWRYYGSHLSAIPPNIYSGLRVNAGDLLGYIGASGNAEGTTPHLHFGISRPTFATDWSTRRGQVDPYPCLVKWQEEKYCYPRPEE